MRALAVFVALLGAATAVAAAEAPCLTMADVLTRELPGFELSPVFRRIYSNPNIKGLLMIPTVEAWKTLESTAAMQNVDLKGENVTATIMSGAWALYWLGQGSVIDPAKLPVNASNPIRVETEARWRCSLPEKRGSVGYGMVLRRDGTGVFVEHGGSQQRARSSSKLVEPLQPLSGTCPGLLVYKVTDIPMPCNSLAALATEVTNTAQNGCRYQADSSISGTLARTNHTHFLQLLIATGLLPAVDKTASPFTILAPSDAAFEAAAARGVFDYAQLFATNKMLLTRAIGYHVSTGQSLRQPSQTSAAQLAPTMMGGDAGCGRNVGPTWSADNIVRGGRGISRAGEVMEACHSTIVPIDSVLLPCCSTFEQLVTGTPFSRGYGAGNNATATAEAPQLQGFLSYAAEQLRQPSVHGGVTTVIVPSQAAWRAFQRAVARANIALSDALLEAVYSSLISVEKLGTDVTRPAVDAKAHVSLSPALPDGAMAKLCPNGGSSSLVIASPSATPQLPVSPGVTQQSPAVSHHRRRLMAAPALPPDSAPGLAVLDGVADRRLINVTGWENICGGGTLLFVDAVPQPCEFPIIKSEADVDKALGLPRSTSGGSAKGYKATTAYTVAAAAVGAAAAVLAL